MRAALIYPHQLFADHPALRDAETCVLVEEPLLMTQYRFHRQKLILHRTSMQHFAGQLRRQRRRVHYVECGELDSTGDIVGVIRQLGVTHAQFVEIMSIGQVLPGPNVVNVALIIGARYFGWRGAFSALAGMMTLPLVIVLALAALYVEFAQVAAAAGALRGMAADAAGLIIGTALRLAASLRGTPIGGFAAVTLATSLAQT